MFWEILAFSAALSAYDGWQSGFGYEFVVGLLNVVGISISLFS
jgi:hypothetical protein